MKFTIALVLSLLSLNARAALPAGFDLAAWQTLTSKVAANGGLLSRTDARTSDSIATAGSELVLVTAKWTIEPDDVKSADQWAYTLAADGSLIYVTHQLITTEYDGTLLSADRLETPALGDAALLSQVGAKIAEWEKAE